MSLEECFQGNYEASLSGLGNSKVSEALLYDGSVFTPFSGWQFGSTINAVKATH